MVALRIPERRRPAATPSRHDECDSELRILVVDDDIEDFFIVSKLLKRSMQAGYQLTHVDNFDDAEKRLRTEKFDAALIDYHIGHRKGSDLILKVQNDCGIPMIMLTGKKIDSEEEADIGSSAFDLLDKNELSDASLRRSIQFAIRRFGIEKRLRESEAMLRVARNDALEANRTKSIFLAQMSHELRTPLNAILGFSEVIKNDVLNEGIGDTYSRYADCIHRSGHHLLSLINDLLDLSKIEAGSAILNIETQDIRKTVEEVLIVVRALAKPHDIEVVNAIPEDMTMLRVDGRAFYQMLVNLLTNAIKFSHAGGTVELSGIMTETSDIVTVRDYGVGIAAKDIPSVLTPFEQVGNCGFPVKSAGTGLGVPITKSLVEEHGGTLELRSAPGVGTVVDLLFPRHI